MKTSPWQKQKQIDGKLYRYYGMFPTKREARDEARRWRDKGRKIRIIRIEHSIGRGASVKGWAIWGR